eukprot:CAMPEP_0174276704 /NCGR_PEP_ID=MMETSP0439-20130205/60537_1 /TAXON_ID=0 /ORGANISM="Stereomyxa ramosa, Strain Chinc5" /LENGTH=224 /DNA_ID=CAMNT_0015368965 /DNA_START=986 /DNA_END=1660 /DNA_ORIENTATION=+
MTYLPEQNKVVMIGGARRDLTKEYPRDEDIKFDRIHVLDLKKKRWKKCKSQLRCKRFGHSATLLPDGYSILIFGGCVDSEQPMTVILDTRSWTLNIPKTYSQTGVKPSSLRYHAAGLIGHRLYIFGGSTDFTHDQHTDGLWILNTRTFEWVAPSDEFSPTTRLVGKSATSRYGHTCQSINGEALIVAGGSKSKSDGAESMKSFENKFLLLSKLNSPHLSRLQKL